MPLMLCCGHARPCSSDVLLLIDSNNGRYDEVLQRGMFSWQQMWNGQGSPDEKNGCCIGPLVESGADKCAASLRSLCRYVCARLFHLAEFRVFVIVID
jgi:hypothetical protein